MSETLSTLSLELGRAGLTRACELAGRGIVGFSRAPIGNSAVALFVAFSALACFNALYHPSGRHPAPLFGHFGASDAEGQNSVAAAARPAPRHVPVVEVVRKEVAEADGDDPVGNDEVREMQRRLTELGFFDGKVDGLYGPRTARAIKAFEKQDGLPVRGMLTAAVVARIASSSPSNGAPPQADRIAELAPPVVPGPPRPAPNLLPAPDKTERASVPIVAAINVAKFDTDPMVVAAVQRGLASLGFLHGKVDGVADVSTAAAIREFESYFNYEMTGRVTPDLVNLLAQNGAEM